MGQDMNRQGAKDAKDHMEPDEEIDRVARVVIGGAIEVHRLLGPGYVESVYGKALAVELRLRGIPFEVQKRACVEYKGHPVGEGFLDFLVAGCLVVELKAVECLGPIHTAQVISYLRATGLALGLLINFNVPLLKQGLRRIILSPPLASLASWRFTKNR